MPKYEVEGKPRCCTNRWFQWDKLSTTHVTTSSSVSTKALLIWRLIAAVLSFVLWIADFATSSRPSMYLLFFTIWGATINWMYFIVTSIVTCMEHRGTLSKMQLHERNACLPRTAAVLHLCAYSFAWGVTAGFWLVLFNGFSTREPVVYRAFSTTFNHGGVLVLQIIEFSLNRIQFPSRQLLYPLVLGFFYMFINGMSVAAGQLIYRAMDWVSVFSYIFAFGVCIFVVCAYFVIQRCVALRETKCKSCRNPGTAHEDSSPSVGRERIDSTAAKPARSGRV